MLNGSELVDLISNNHTVANVFTFSSFSLIPISTEAAHFL